MRFVWDAEKERRNRVKHGFDFDLAAYVFADPDHVAIIDLDETREERWLCYGFVLSRLIVVVHTFPDPDDPELIRVIGLRKATIHERRRYATGG